MARRENAPKLDRAIVVAAALELLNETGLDELTTRKLAGRLGVQQPALYWHFPNKRALLDALAEEMLTRGHTRSRPRTGENWRSFLLENARSFRRALLAYRDGARIHAGTGPSAPQFGDIEAQLQLLCSAGLTPADAARALVAFGRYVVGSAIEQQADEQDHGERSAASGEPAVLPPLLAQAFAAFEQASPDDVFEYGLALLLEGLAARISPPQLP